MPNYSSKTVPIACRVSTTAWAILKRMADKRGLRISEYIRERLEIDATRKR